MKLPAAIFREYDIRGTVGDQLTVDVAHAIGQALATVGWERLGRAPKLAVGRDNRPSGAEYAGGVLTGIAAAGGVAVDVGELPTPALYFATHTLDVDGGIQVTGSHNPPEFNGFKLVLGPEPIYGAEIQGLRRLIEEGRTRARPGGRRSQDGTVLPRYRDAIVERNGPLPRRVKTVVDCGNGVASVIAVDTLRRLGAEVIPLFCESDGRFPNHHPDPTVPENLRDLQAAVRRERAELGIAFDGDGDRIGAVDEQGRPVFGDQLLVLLGRDLARRMGGGHAVIFDVKCSEVLPRELARVGLKPTMWKTGHSLIKQKMKESGAPLAGEMSGHMFFGGDWYGFDDALFAAARPFGIKQRSAGRSPGSWRTCPPRSPRPRCASTAPTSRSLRLWSARRSTSRRNTRCRRWMACASRSRKAGACYGHRTHNRCWSCALRRRPPPRWLPIGPKSRAG